MRKISTDRIAWIGAITGIVGAITGILGFLTSYAAILRDRPEVNVELVTEHTIRPMIEGRHPGIKFGPHWNNDEVSQKWYVFTAVNTGLRPVHIERVIIINVEVHGPGSSSSYLPHDVLLNEEHRRTSIAFTDEIPRYRLWAVAFLDDTGHEYVSFGSSYSSWWSRRNWKRQRDRLLAERIEEETRSKRRPQPSRAAP